MMKKTETLLIIHVCSYRSGLRARLFSSAATGLMYGATLCLSTTDSLYYRHSTERNQFSTRKPHYICRKQSMAYEHVPWSRWS